MGTKVIVEREVTCAFCGKVNKLKVEKETITKPEPGEYEFHVSVEKADQSKLDTE